jgi:hypothetical protein
VLAGGERFTRVQRLFRAVGGANDELMGSLVRELALSLSGLCGRDAWRDLDGSLERPWSARDVSVGSPKYKDSPSSSNAIASSGMPSTSRVLPD